MIKHYILFIPLFTTSLLMADAASEYQQKCANCHGVDGRQSALGKSAAIAGKETSSLIHDLKGYKAGRLNKNGMGGLMKAQVKALSNKQISTLSAYISTLPQ